MLAVIRVAGQLCTPAHTSKVTTCFTSSPQTSSGSQFSDSVIPPPSNELIEAATSSLASIRGRLFVTTARLTGPRQKMPLAEAVAVDRSDGLHSGLQPSKNTQRLAVVPTLPHPGKLRQMPSLGSRWPALPVSWGEMLVCRSKSNRECRPSLKSVALLCIEARLTARQPILSRPSSWNLPLWLEWATRRR
jgi:hypothetical protein